MATTAMQRRLADLECDRTSVPARYSPEELEGLARQYAAFLREPFDPDPRYAVYIADRSLERIAWDYEDMLRGGSALGL